MTEPSASLAVNRDGTIHRLAFSGHLDADGVASVWGRTMTAATAARGHSLALDLSGVAGCDMAGATMLAAAEGAHGGQAEISGASEQVVGLIARARAASKVRPARAAGTLEPLSWRNVLKGLAAAGDGIAFLGEAAMAVAALPSRRRMLRFRDLLRFLDEAGVRSLPLVIMLGFLIGVILAFQSATEMRQFGAVVYAVSLVSISLTRELGPLMAAIILSGRTASAFAAEIGTMKVNEEVNALLTMGLDPMTMLVLPRLVAALLVMPVMTVVLELAGLVGMAVVMKGFGFALPIIAGQVQYWTTPTDLFGGLLKAVCFGAAIGAIGCRSGLVTGKGPRAVGVSATAAVVGGIVSTVVLDGVFAVLYTRLGF